MVTTVMGKSFRAKELVSIGLKSKFYGISKQDVSKICAKLGLYPAMRMHQLTEQQVLGITKELSDLTIEGDARSIIRSNIALKRSIGSYQGMRHAMGLPVHGQRTRTNAKTARKLNRVERRGYSTATATATATTTSITHLPGNNGVFSGFKNLLKAFI